MDKLQITDNISVAVRIRPLNAKELAKQCGVSWQWDDTSITQLNPLTGKPIPTATYTFGKDNQIP